MASPPNPDFVLGPSLQEFFIDKNNNLPLSNGLVFFYSDNNRNILKPVYEIQGNNISGYTFVPLPNPVILSGAGTIQDNNGNDVLPYYFPFDSTGALELYYIVVMDQFGSPQFTREAFPGNSFTLPMPNQTQNINNLVPNGQFLLHNNHIPVPYPSVGSPNNFTYPTVPPTTVNVVPVAPGGWTYERTSTSIATDTITFTRYPSPTVSPPSTDPRYAINITRTSASADPICDLRLRFNDVNKFAGQKFTLIFAAQDSIGTLTNVNVKLIKYYGSGSGTATTDTTFAGPFTLDPMMRVFVASGTLPIASGTVGANDDDFLQFAIRFTPGNTTLFNINITDVMLIPGEITQAVGELLNFPNITNGEFVLQALSNIAPVPPFGAALSSTTNNYYQQDGSNLYLPIIMTTEGFSYDTSQLGTIVGKITNTPVNNELLCNGQQLTVSDYSSIGIPYSRLFNVLFNSSINAPIFGTGTNFVNVTVSSAITNQFIITQNKSGAQSNPADGGGGTTFTFVTPVYFPGTVQIEYISYANSGGTVTAIHNLNTGSILNPAADVDTGFTITEFNTGGSSIGGLRYAFTIFMAGLPLDGKAFDFSSVAVNYRLFYDVNGSGTTPPLAGRTGIRVNILSTMSVADVANITANAIASQQVNGINTVAAAAIPDSAYFIFFANGSQYTVWYNKGANAQPLVGGTVQYIKVDINPLDTSAQVATKTQIAINSVFFAVPDLRGVFLRGLDSNATPIWDIDVLTRYGFMNNLPGNSVGTFEVDEYIKHVHISGGPAAGGSALSGGTTGVNTSISGGSETRPTNMSVNWFIKY